MFFNPQVFKILLIRSGLFDPFLTWTQRPEALLGLASPYGFAKRQIHWPRIWRIVD